MHEIQGINQYSFPRQKVRRAPIYMDTSFQKNYLDNYLFLCICHGKISVGWKLSCNAIQLWAFLDDGDLILASTAERCSLLVARCVMWYSMLICSLKQADARSKKGQEISSFFSSSPPFFIFPLNQSRQTSRQVPTVCRFRMLPVYNIPQVMWTLNGEKASYTIVATLPAPPSCPPIHMTTINCQRSYFLR